MSWSEATAWVLAVIVITGFAWLGAIVIVDFAWLLLPKRRNRRRRDVLPPPREECKRPGVQACP